MLEIRRGQFQQPLAKRRGKLAHGDAFMRDDPIVPISAAEVALIGRMPAPFRHRRIMHQLINSHPALQFFRQRPHQLQAKPFLVLEQSQPGIRPAIDTVRFGPDKNRRQHHLVVQHETIQAQMVTEQVPAPGLRQRRLPEQAEIVAVLVHHTRRVDQFAKETIGPHRATRLGEACGTQAGAQHRQNRLAQRISQFVQPQTETIEIQFRIAPHSPLRRIDGKAQPSPLRPRSQRSARRVPPPPWHRSAPPRRPGQTDPAPHRHSS